MAEYEPLNRVLYPTRDLFDRFACNPNMDRVDDDTVVDPEDGWAYRLVTVGPRFAIAVHDEAGLYVGDLPT